MRYPRVGDEVTVEINGRPVRGRVDEVTTKGYLVIKLAKVEQARYKVRSIIRGIANPEIEILDAASLLAELA